MARAANVHGWTVCRESPDISDLSCTTVGNTSRYPLRFEPQALRGYRLVLPPLFQPYPHIHYSQLSSRSDTAGGVP